MKSVNKKFILIVTLKKVYFFFPHFWPYYFMLSA